MSQSKKNSTSKRLVFTWRPFSRIVPCVKDIGLWGEKVQKCYAEMGVLDMAGSNLDDLMKADEDQAELLDREKAAMEARIAEVDTTIAVGANA